MTPKSTYLLRVGGPLALTGVGLALAFGAADLARPAAAAPPPAYELVALPPGVDSNTP